MYRAVTSKFNPIEFTPACVGMTFCRTAMTLTRNILTSSGLHNVSYVRGQISLHRNLVLRRQYQLSRLALSSLLLLVPRLMRLICP